MLDRLLGKATAFAEAKKIDPYAARSASPSYLFTFALPNFMFHFTTAYAILRHNGLEIGKLDFLGPF